MLRGSARKGVDVTQDAPAQIVRHQIGVALGQIHEPLIAKAVALLVHRLADAVGVEHEEVATTERQRHFFE